jgi:hypothetical protein
MPSSHASTGAHQLTDDDKRFRNFAGVDRHPDTLTSINNLATLLQAKATDDALEQARPLLVEAAAVSKQVLGDDHPHSLIFGRNLEKLNKEIKRRDDLKAKYLGTMAPAASHE